jgi:hypothetical protein
MDQGWFFGRSDRYGDLLRPFDDGTAPRHPAAGLVSCFPQGERG